jgi:hypothetical protein
MRPKKVSAVRKAVCFLVCVLFLSAAARNKFRVHALGKCHRPSLKKIVVFFIRFSGSRTEDPAIRQMKSNRKSDFSGSAAVMFPPSGQAENFSPVLRGEAADCFGGEFIRKNLS